MKLTCLLLLLTAWVWPCGAQQPDGSYEWPRLTKTTFTIADAHRSLLTLEKSRTAYFQNESAPDRCGRMPKWLTEELQPVPYTEAPLRVFIRDTGSMGCLILVTDAEGNAVSISAGLSPASSWGGLSATLKTATMYKSGLDLQEERDNDAVDLAAVMDKMLVTAAESLNFGARLLLHSVDPKEIPLDRDFVNKRVRI